MTAPILTTRGLGLDYGKFTAVGEVDLQIRPRTLHSLIGPNGAGKTSLFNIVSGRAMASRGSIHFDGRDITRSPAHSRVSLGMARSFQVTSLFPESGVLENLRLAALGRRARQSLRFWRNWERDAARQEVADEVLEQLELKRLAQTPVGELSHGTQRLVEIGMCLVARPSMLLLDEPMAGLGLADIPRVTDLLAQLKASHTILLVEHNMHVVMELSDRITVMFQGNVVAEGTPGEIRENADVKRVYLGSSV